MHEWTQCACVYDDSTGETPSELLPVAKEVRIGLHFNHNGHKLPDSIIAGNAPYLYLLQGNSSKLTEEYHALEKLSDELREVEKTLSLLLINRKEEEKPGYWTRVAKKVNRYFFILYITVVSLFLIYISFEWSNA